MAQAPHIPTEATRQQVEILAGYGIPERDLARAIGIRKTTLQKYYRPELDNGHIRANLKVAQNLFRMACGDGHEAVTAAIFWLKTRARWRTTPEGATPEPS